MILVMVAVFLMAMIPAALAQGDDASQGGNAYVMANGSHNRTDEAVQGVRPIFKALAARQVQAMNSGQLRETLQARFQAALANCNNSENETACQTALQHRIAVMANVSAASLDRLKVFEQRRLTKLADFDTLINSSNFSKYRPANGFMARVIPQVALRNAQRGLVAAKAKFFAAKSRMDIMKGRFNAAKAKALACEGNATAECNATMEQMNDLARGYLLNITDVILGNLDTLNNSVQSNEYLTDNESADLLARIANETATIQSIRADIEAAQTKGDIIAAGKELRQEWARMHPMLDILSLKTVNARVGEVVVRAQQLDVRLEGVMEKMQENGHNTTTIQPLVDNFTADISAAKDDYQQAMTLFNESKQSGDQNSSLVNQTRQLMQDAQKSLQDAQKMLQRIVNTIRSEGATEDLSDASDAALAAVDQSGDGEGSS
jgi:methyl-accepting chemotaxis protein